VNKQIKKDEVNKGGIEGKKKYPKRDKTQYSNRMRFDVVVVLGMHRSGTSALTKGLVLFGVDLGKNLMAPQEDNPKGYFEDAELVQINDRILAKGCSHWSSIQFLDPKFLSGPELSEERMSAGNWLNMKVANGNPVGLKDPRLCRTLPFWQPLFAEARLRVGYVLAYRAPMEIAASLQKRNGFGLSYGVDLWAAYAADALFHIQGKSWIAVGFPQLLEEPRRELARIADFLETPWNPDREAVKEYEKEYLDPALWHHRTAESIPQQENCYREISNALSILCVKKNNKAEKQAQDAVQAVFERVGKISNALSENNRILFHQFAEQAKELEKIRKLLDERTAWAQALDKEVKKTRKLFQEEQKLVEERTIWGKALDKELALSKETSSMALFQAEEADKRAKLAEDQQIRLNYIGDYLAEIKEEVSTQKAVNANVAKELGISLVGLKQELEAQKVATSKGVKELGDSLVGLKQELEAQKVATSKGVEELGDSLVGLKQELIHELRGLVSGLNERQDQLQQRNLAEMDTLRTSLVDRLGKNENHLMDLAKYAEQIQDSVIAPSSYLVPAPFVWYSYLYKMLHIKKPGLLNKTSGAAPKRPGFWRRLERSIRKRRKRWIGGVGFDRDWYLKEYPDVARAGIDPLDHYIQFGIQEGRWKSETDKQNRPNPHKKRVLEDLLLGELGKNIRKQLWLLWSYPRVKAQLKLSFRLLEKNFPFDPIWYQVKYPDVKGTSMSPFMHFIEYGAREGRLPNRRFSQECYLALAPEVASSGIPAPLHFLMEGWKEGRLINWLDRYVEQSSDREIRERISGLLDLLLAQEDHEDLSGARERKISLLRNRLSLALRNRASPTEEPKVSIIIPVYNQVAYTLACVTSLYESNPSTTFEVIIADDCSNDGTREIFKEFSPWIKMVRTSGNLGFLRNCNNAAKEARGEYLVFLNNDMVVLPRWLDELLGTFAWHPDCGMCGSKLLNLDGTLQEAGGIFWKDGSAWNYGRNQNPNLPEFNYVRRTDYCSGASLCLPKKHWDTLGGFDEIYERAYCEDADLSFRLRAELSLETYYQPFSEGIHLEGATSGRDTSQGEKACQVTNQKKLLERWKKVLEKEHLQNGFDIFLARGRSTSRKVVLIADHYIPEDDKDAGSRTMSQIAKLFIKNKTDVVFWPANLNYTKEYAERLQKAGVYVIYNTEKTQFLGDWLRENKKFIKGFLIARPHVLQEVLHFIKANSESKIFFYGMDVHHLRIESELKNNPHNQKLRKDKTEIETLEKMLWEQVDVLLYPAQSETEYIKSYLREKERVITCRTMPVFYWESFPDSEELSTNSRSGLFYVAGFNHPPNVEGILWFTDNVFPLILKKLPHCILTIAGSNPPPQIINLESKNIKILGFISDEQLKLNYKSKRVAIAPLLSGAGMKGKVAEALKNGLPIVTTSFGAQGFEEEAYAVPALSEPHQMAAKICSLLLDDKEWLDVAIKSVNLAKKRFSEKNMWNTLKDLIE